MLKFWVSLRFGVLKGPMGNLLRPSLSNMVMTSLMWLYVVRFKLIKLNTIKNSIS